ncbi:TPA: hypothetical protein SCR96_003984 [Escherichia coli]|nr:MULTISPECIES: GDSL-type esterase/lipase family protein [Escherichia]EGN8022445.1 hypothetical protein [Escherichia coli]EOV88093.1 hypothetical protein A1WG_04324 [Escherichia sp. KTE96]EOV92427.1 hypothetical protein A1WG_01488 [Escherichia sp. KTE96]EOV93193.1 hypothetical protein A1WG_01292 [Escherichia sp. KTE96]EOV96097.1 hypothetical protein A1WG_00002 [Escherichia sp. KTE96]
MIFLTFYDDKNHNIALLISQTVNKSKQTSKHIVDNLFIFMFLLSIPFFSFASDTNKTPPYRMRESMFELLKEQRDIVMLGDSITARGEWNELLPSLSVANRGIGGDEVKFMKRRIDSIFLLKPKYVFIMGGTNDFRRKRSVDDVVRDYKHIIKKLHKHRINVFIQSTLYVSRESRLNDNIKILKLNNAINNYCSVSNYCRFVDLNVHMAKDRKILAKYSDDGVHLNGNGYLMWASIIYPLIKK